MSAKPVRFISTVSKRGDAELVITIPKADHDKVKHLWRRKIKVTVEEITL